MVILQHFQARSFSPLFDPKRPIDPMHHFFNWAGSPQPVDILERIGNPASTVD
jgi:hypothetical protein